MWKKSIAATVVFTLGFSAATVLAAGDTHRAAAEQFAALVQADRALSSACETMLDAQVQANPDLKPHREALLGFLRQNMSWENLKEDILGLYMETFTETELQELIAFYSTPTGQKSVEAMPDIMRRGSEIGIQRIQAHLPELEALLKAKPESAE